MKVRQLCAALALVGFGLGVPSAHAATVLTLDNPGAVSYQQTDNSPCVIGDPSCNNPAGFGSTTIPANTSTYTLDSPTYTIQQIRDIVGNSFFVGIDVNTTEKPLATEFLVSFSMTIAGTEEFTYTGPTQLVVNANGNGYSDSLLKGFDISSFAANAQAFFTASVRGATDGREEFFLINSASPPAEIPIPAAAWLLGSGLMAMGAIGRRRIKGMA